MSEFDPVHTNPKYLKCKELEAKVEQQTARIEELEEGIQELWNYADNFDVDSDYKVVKVELRELLSQQTDTLTGQGE